MSFRQFLTEDNKNITVYFDLDETIASFSSIFLKHNKGITKKELVKQEIPDDEFWPMVLKIDKFWESLDIIPNGIKLLKYASDNGFDVQILSSPSSHDSRSIPGKKIWIKKNLSKYNISKVNLVTSSKKKEYATANSILVDDLKKNVDEFLQAGGNALLFNDEDPSMLSKFKKQINNMKTSLNEGKSFEYVFSDKKKYEDVKYFFKDMNTFEVKWKGKIVKINPGYDMAWMDHRKLMYMPFYYKDIIEKLLNKKGYDVDFNDNNINESIEILTEKQIVYNNGKKYGQVVFLSGGAGCFVGDTLVKTQDGYEKIEDIKEGTLVFTYNEETKENEYKPVQKHNKFETHNEKLLELEFDNGQKVVCTENHEFFVDGQWIEAKELYDVSKKVIGEVSVDTPVYDLSIDDNHNYYVSESDILVHNSGKGFASENFMDIHSFKVRDVDAWKQTFLKIAQLKNKYPEIQGLQLKNPSDVFKLHMFVKKKGVKDKTLDLLLTNASEGRLPNIMFDITGKDMSDITDVLPNLLEVGYQAEDIHLSWVLTNYSIAVKQNSERERIVPDDIMLDTHTGAANTMWKIINKGKLPKGMDGGFYVILNNKENTIFYSDKEGNLIKNSKGNPTIKDFKYVQIKTPKGKMLDTKGMKKQLHQWIMDNVPKTELTKYIWTAKINESISSVNELEKALDQISNNVKDVKLSKHFIERLKEREIDLDNVAETIEKFFNRYKPSLSQSHQKEISGLIKHMLTDLNIVISYDTNGTTGNLSDDVLKLVTVIKKKNFKNNNSKDTIYKVR